MKKWLKSTLAFLLVFSMILTPVFSATGLAAELDEVQEETMEQADIGDEVIETSDPEAEAEEVKAAEEAAEEAEQEGLLDTEDSIAAEGSDEVENEAEESSKGMKSAVVPTAAGWTTSKPSGSVVMAYGTPATAIASGPVYGSQLYYQVSTTANTNNRSFTIPSVNTFFVLNPGWEIDYVNVSGNSSGQRQPGASFLLASSGGTMVYYFKQGSYTLTTQTAVDGSVVSSSTQTAKAGSSVSVSPSTSSFDTANYNYTFTGWTVVSGSGTFGSSGTASTTFNMSSSGATIRANYTKTAKSYTLSVQTAVDGQVVSTVSRGSYASGSGVNIYPDTSSFDWLNNNYTFTGWVRVSGSGSFADAAQEETRYTTGSSATVVRANFEKVEAYPLTVETVVNGEVVASEVVGSYLPGASVNISSDKSGFDTFTNVYTFDGWVIDSGNGSFADASQESTVFTTGSAPTVVQAVYTEEELIVRAQLIVFYEDVDTGVYLTVHMDELVGAGQHTVVADPTHIPDGYVLDPANQEQEVTVVSTGLNQYYNAYTVPTFVVFTMRQGTQVEAQLTVKLEHYSTGAVMEQYVRTLGEGTHTITPDASEMPTGYSAYPEHQSAVVTVASDGTINPSEVTFYIAEINPVPLPTQGRVLYWPNTPPGAVQSGGTWAAVLNTNEYHGSRFDLPLAFNEGDPLTYDGYEFVGWSTTATGTDLFTETYMMPSTGNVNLFAIWRATEN